MHSIASAESLKSEISYRFKSLSKRFDADIDDLGDYQILEIHQDKKNVDHEFSSVLGKVNELSSLVSTGGDKVEKLYIRASKTRDRLFQKRETFFAKLQEVILKRDITADKMKSALDVAIEVPKFSGYDGIIDIYTFRSEFKKLVEPRVQKKYYADYLKRNYLSGPASVLVQKETDYEKIWERLLSSYGNTRLLLQNKLSTLDKLSLSNVRGDQKISVTLASLINTMQDLSALAAEHDIEGQLYEGGGPEKVLFLIGESKHRKFRSQNLGHTYTKKQEWQKLKEFLETDLRLREKLSLDYKTAEQLGLTSGKENPSKVKSGSHNATVGQRLLCHICDKEGHTIVTTARGTKILPYYVCEIFLKMSHEERLARLESKNLCTVCLFPGAVKSPQHKCHFTNFCCPSHGKQDKIHVLLCGKHKKEPKNVALLEKFKDRFINKCPADLPEFVKSFTFFSVTEIVHVSRGLSATVGTHEGIPDITDSSIFLLQRVQIDTVVANFFFDNGCGGMIIKESFAIQLVRLGRAEKIDADPFELRGVADQKTICTAGFYKLCLPLHNGQNAIATAIALTKITSDFPEYELTEVQKELNGCRQKGGSKFRLPRLPKSVGGDTDLLIGSRYMRYFPKTVKRLQSGLEILKSSFKAPDGTRGVLLGPHPSFAKFETEAHHGTVAYLASTKILISLWKAQDSLLCADRTVSCDVDQVSCDEMIELLDVSQTVCVDDAAYVAKRAPKQAKIFDEIEASGTEVTFRCVDCRGCKRCKSGPQFESISIQEEVEQNLIEKCVTVDIDLKITMSKLPFLVDPNKYLAPNEHVARRVWKTQLQKLNANPEDRKSVLEFEQKLQDMGFVDYVSNLKPSEREMIINSESKYFIPWRPVWNPNSISTPCRLTFDASMGGREGCSLNSVLAKGANSLNNLLGITLRWTMHQSAFHADVQKMYNKVLLDPCHWRYQLYLFSKDLNIDDVPQWKVIKTLIYGVRPSGSLAVCGLRRTVELCKEEYPLAYSPIADDTYMDDCASGSISHEKTLQVTDQIQVALSIGGFSLKGFTISGSDPPEHLTSDGKSIHLLGLKWFPKGDFYQLNVGERNFARKVRGRKPSKIVGNIPENLSLSDCISRSSEVFDPLGRVAPLVAGIKVDRSVIHKQCVGWEDPIPSELKAVWAANFDLIDEIGKLRFHRAVVPLDAVNLDVETINTADAGENLVCAAIYARFLRKDGSHSCQLIFARTKIIHNISTPRAELVAAVLNASTSHVVKVSLKDMHKRAWYITDSQVTLHWLNSLTTALKMYVRNRVVEVLRLTDISDWFYTERSNNISDLGTRKGATIEDIKPGSLWDVGLPWMRGQEKEFPFETVNDLILSAKEKSELSKEKILPEGHTVCESVLHATYVPQEVEKRYQFSQYLLSPNKYRFRTVVRVLALVFLFIKKISIKLQRKFEFLDVQEHVSKVQYSVFTAKSATDGNVTERVAIVRLGPDILQAAKDYYFRKASREIEKFVDPSRYQNKSLMKNGILYFTGRILRTQQIDGNHGLSDVTLDLSSATFRVLMTDFHSPLAYAVVAETHWYDPDVKHQGVECTLRYAQNVAYIIGGRRLVKAIQKDCTRCRILHKKGVRVAMGPIGEENLKVAPPFYFCQVDLCGPFDAYSPANRKATLKVWLVIFCCTTTGTVDCRVMHKYDTDSFLLSFIRFSCRFGYPKMLLPDEGSQLVKGCKGMILSFSDIAHTLITEHGVEFKVCPVGAHYVHGKVERKIQQIKRSFEKSLGKKRLAIIQWETLGQQVCNSINNLPLGLGNKTECLDTLDLLTPNRLLLGRNNNRCPTEPLELSGDYRGIVASNAEVFKSWFREWVVNYVPHLVEQPKWFVSDRSVREGDVVLFTKSEKEFDKTYQYGIVVTTVESRDGLIREVIVEYKNHNEQTKRTTRRGVCDIVVIHPVEEIGIAAELHNFSESVKHEL